MNKKYCTHIKDKYLLITLVCFKKGKPYTSLFCTYNNIISVFETSTNLSMTLSESIFTYSC